LIAWCALVLLGAFTAATAAATPLDKRTTFTFSAPFTVPGVTLPAGTYVFRLADDLRGRDIVQVLGAENGTAYAMFHTLRTPRGTPVDKPELRFMETASDMPVAIKSWWYPAETQGYEFLYPRRQAELLAKGTGTPVVTEAPVEDEEYVRIIPAEPATPEAFEEPAVIGEVAEIAEEAAPVTQAAEPAALPKTGSPTATLLLLGALALLAAVGLRTVRAVRT
jgi:LPXTG-motif cell wall-anchored protein